MNLRPAWLVSVAMQARHDLCRPRLTPFTSQLMPFTSQLMPPTTQPGTFHNPTWHLPQLNLAHLRRTGKRYAGPGNYQRLRDRTLWRECWARRSVRAMQISDDSAVTCAILATLT